ncbi:MAG TPA: hypothetical protein VIC08_13340 [Cellvibrionaceae bacterium]
MSQLRADEAASDAVLRISIPPIEDSASNHSVYFPQMLQLALEKTRDSDGPFEIIPYSQLLTTARFLQELTQDGVVNVMWIMRNTEHEQDLLAVPVPLLKGLNSHRIFLIKDSAQESFAAINSLQQLRQLRAGQGAHWVDVDVLQANGLPVVVSAHYELLFNMLAQRRFDYFPRGLYEIWDEHKKHADKGLAIEQTLMFYYPAPIYFFTSPKRPELADRIYRGLKIALEDGSFDQLFLSIPGFKRGYEELYNHKRRIFHLTHPDTDDSRVDIVDP